jgi:splicing factor 3B subunit 1
VRPTEGVTPQYIKHDILPEFSKSFWVRRVALDRWNYHQVVETIVKLAQKAGVSEIVGRIVNDLKDEAELYRKMVMETITKVVTMLGASDIDERLEVRLVDGIIYSFQEQTTEDQVMLDGFGTVVNALGIRVKPYLTQIVSTVLLAAQQQEREGSAASRRSHDRAGCRDQAVWGGLTS